MVQCAMCNDKATTQAHVSNYGILACCEWHKIILKNHEIVTKKLQNKKMRDILTEILNALNEHYIKIPIVQAPTRKFENNGIRSGLKMAIAEIEKRLEELIRE